jgi:Ser/Thr protein kinase RdoA (MazF antagonist)
MAADLFAPDPAFAGARRSGDHVEELIEYARAQLGLGADRPWTLVSSRGKLGKTFFEVDENGTRIIGKMSRSERAQNTFQLLRTMWDAGMRPPSQHTVTRPIAWLPEKHLLLQEKARGEQLIALIQKQTLNAVEGVARAGEWLHTLRSLQLRPAPASDMRQAIARCRAELSAALPEQRARVERLLDEVEDAPEYGGPLAPSHGDYHPMNVFVAEDRVTAIDVDTFALREPAFDVAYFVAQTAIMGFHVFDNFAATRELREVFRSCAPPAPEERVALHVRFALVRSLHYDLCILKVKDRGFVEPFLRAAGDGLDQ